MASIRKMQIGRFAPQIEKVDHQAALDLWHSIRVAVDAIYEKNVSQYRYEVLHRSVYKLIINRHGDVLYDGISDSISKRISSSLATLLAAPLDQFLPQLTHLWNEHIMMTSRIREILLYSEQNYIAQSKKMPVYDLGLLLFRDQLVLVPAVHAKITLELLRYVRLERDGYGIDRDCVRTVLSMLLELGIHGANLYESIFEFQFLAETKSFYHCEIQSFLADNTCSNCLAKIECRLQEEARRAQHYLPLSTGRKLDAVVESELVENTALALVNMDRSGAAFMLRENRAADLKLMFRVLCRLPSTLEYLRDCLHEYIVTVGTGIMSDAASTKDFIKFVQEVLQLKKIMTSLIADCFENETKFQNKFKLAFDHFLNKEATTTASYIAMYTDDQLKNGFRSLTDADVETCIDGVVSLLQHVQDKDIFESYYKAHLTKRLMGSKAISEEIEKQVVSKLKSEYGYQFTSKLERMFSDINISRTTMAEYREAVLGRPEYLERAGLDCEFTVLTAGFWPAQSHDDSQLVLPPVLKACRDSFVEFYASRHSARRVSWQFSLGSVDMKMTLGRVRHDLNVSLYQALILHMFNEKDSLTYGSIQDVIQIPEVELKRHLLSLINPKLRILQKASAGKSIQGVEDEFSLNFGFASKFRRIKIPLMSLASVQGSAGACRSGEEAGVEEPMDGGIPAQVMEARKYAIDSALVRILKARKTISHNDLIAEVTHQLNSRFSATPQMLKMRIESLIEREYLARDRNTPNMYSYIA